MTTKVLMFLLIGFAVISVVFLLAARGWTRNSKWPGLVAIALAAPFFFWLGAFSEQFTSGQCYSRSISNIANAVSKTESPVVLSQKIRSLPLSGYETVCADVEKESEKLPNVVAP
jgi:4-amino-4-deoxy-L-arabinose transferase-like glycosyltransferase